MVDLDTFVSTRRSLHAVAEYVLAAVRSEAEGRIGLIAIRHGFATPPIPPDGRIVAVEGDHLVDERGVERREAAVTTLREAGEFFGVAPGVPGSLWAPVNAVGLDDRLPVDPAAAAEVATWLDSGTDALERVVATAVAEDGVTAAVPTLWPEHFDLAVTLAEVNVGASLGDSFCEEPYWYVGPWSPPPQDGAIWNAPFGAFLPRSQVRDLDAAVEFLLDRCRRAWA